MPANQIQKINQLLAFTTRPRITGSQPRLLPLTAPADARLWLIPNRARGPSAHRTHTSSLIIIALRAAAASGGEVAHGGWYLRICKIRRFSGLQLMTQGWQQGCREGKRMM